MSPKNILFLRHWLSRRSLACGNRVVGYNRHNNKAFIRRLFLTPWNLAVSLIWVKNEWLIDVFGYDTSTDRIASLRNPLSGCISYSVRLLQLLVLLRWAHARASRCETSNRYRLSRFFCANNYANEERTEAINLSNGTKSTNFRISKTYWRNSGRTRKRRSNRKFKHQNSRTDIRWITWLPKKSCC